MPQFSRRRAIVAGSVTVLGVGAGCLGSSSDSDDGPTDAVTADSEIAYPEFVDDNATYDEPMIEYENRDVQFSLYAMASDDADADTPQVQRDLDTNGLAAFIAPEYGDDESLSYHVFATEQFVDYADWNVIFTDDDEYIEDEPATFDELAHGVYYLMVTPRSEGSITAISNTDADTPPADDPESVSVGIMKGDAPESDESVPRVRFITHGDHSDDTRSYEITHDGGDELEGDYVYGLIDDDRIENPFDSDPVTEGDSASFDDLSEGTEISIVYDDGKTSDELVSVSVD